MEKEESDTFYFYHPPDWSASTNSIRDKIEIGNDPNFTRTLFKVLELRRSRNPNATRLGWNTKRWHIWYL
jgi:hypothetical protein